jgi:hypothetical protein
MSNTQVRAEIRIIGKEKFSAASGSRGLAAEEQC